MKNLENTKFELPEDLKKCVAFHGHLCPGLVYGYLVAKEAIKYSCTRQLPNGAWLYGEDPMNHWIDNFHTGYNLDALKCYIENMFYLY